jgi:hypothetical protein
MLLLLQHAAGGDGLGLKVLMGFFGRAFWSFSQRGHRQLNSENCNSISKQRERNSVTFNKAILSAVHAKVYVDERSF